MKVILHKRKSTMNTISIKTGEEIHHTCLMYGLNRAYARYPFLARNPLATPPPFRRSPERPALFIGCGMSPVCVQYYKTDMRVLYKKNKVTADEAAAFAKAIMEEREKGEFKNIEDLRLRTGSTKSVLDILQTNGCFDGMSESNQVSFFEMQ